MCSEASSLAYEYILGEGKLHRKLQRHSRADVRRRDTESAEDEGEVTCPCGGCDAFRWTKAVLICGFMVSGGGDEGVLSD